MGFNCETWGDQCHGPLGHGFDYFYGLPHTLEDDAFEDEDHPFLIFPVNSKPHRTLAGTYFALLIMIFILDKLGFNKYCVKFFLCGTFVFISMWFFLAHFRVYEKVWWNTSKFMRKLLKNVLMRNNEVIEQPVTLPGLTQRFVKESVSFLETSQRNRARFLLYHSFAHVHTPLFAAPQFVGKSKYGAYGDNVEELDWAVGKILNALDRLGLSDNTFVYFVSDHGADINLYNEYGQRVGGYNGIYRG